MLHGNPTWSFYYRNLARALRGDYRVIVPDHVGCGLSDKPDDSRYDYTLESRVRDIECLLDRLGIRDNLTLVLHDWGGMIGMAVADRDPGRIKQVVLLNTGAFLLPRQKRFPWPLKLVRTALGEALVLRANAFSRTAARVCCRRKKMPPALRELYCAPYENRGDRIATLRFVQDIPLQPSDRSYALVSGVSQRLATFRDRRALICWGGRDFVFDAHFLAEWRRQWPQAEVHEFPDCGHYVLEDASEEIIPLVRNFLAGAPRAH
jgi:haloalkane dehalogenase